MSLDEKVTMTLQQADKFKQAGMLSGEGEEEGQETKQDAHGVNLQSGDMLKPSNYDHADFELPSHVDRPPSPIMFARTLTKLRVAEDVPGVLLERAVRRTMRCVDKVTNTSVPTLRSPPPSPPPSPGPRLLAGP